MEHDSGKHENGIQMGLSFGGPTMRLDSYMTTISTFETQVCLLVVPDLPASLSVSTTSASGYPEGCWY